MRQENEVDPVSMLGGTALKVYLFLLQSNRPVGIRELQKFFGFKSPTTARHHLERLVELGLAKKDYRGYIAVKPSGILGRTYLFVGRIIPYNVFLTSFLGSSTAICILTQKCGFLGLLFLSIATTISLFETFQYYREIRRLFRN